MDSATRNISLPTTVRVGATVTPDSGAGASSPLSNPYSCSMTKVAIGTGFAELLSLSPLLFLPVGADPKETFSLVVSDVQVVLDDSSAVVAADPAPNATAAQCVIATADMEITRLDPDPSAGTATVEFRVTNHVLEPIVTHTVKAYTVGQWATYRQGGVVKKFVCKLNTTTNQLPTDPVYWEYYNAAGDNDGIVIFHNVYLTAAGYRRVLDLKPVAEVGGGAAVAHSGGTFGDTATNAYVVPAGGQAAYTTPGAAQVITFNFGTAAEITQNDWVEFTSPFGDYFLWFDKGTGSIPAGTGSGIKVDISALTTDVEVATAVKAALDADLSAIDDMTCSVGAAGAITITCKAVGVAAAPVATHMTDQVNNTVAVDVAGTANAGKIWIDLADVVRQTSVDTVELVLGAFSCRNVAADEIDYDILKADGVTEFSCQFRYVA